MNLCVLRDSDITAILTAVGAMMPDGYTLRSDRVSLFVESPDSSTTMVGAFFHLLARVRRPIAVRDTVETVVGQVDSFLRANGSGWQYRGSVVVTDNPTVAASVIDGQVLVRLEADSLPLLRFPAIALHG